MASRQLRKLQKQRELLDIQNKAARDESSDDEPVVAKPRGNLFSGFAALGDEGDDHDTDEDEVEPQEPTPTPVVEQLDGETAPAKKSKKSKKKKKKGKKPEVSAAEEGHESFDEIDRVLAELNVTNPNTKTSPGASAAKDPETQIAQLLHINFQHLKAMNEMRKMFGNTEHVAETEAQPAAPRTRGQQGVDLETYLTSYPRQGKKGMFETVLRTNPFIEGKKTWPRDSTHGLKMERLGSDDYGFVEFTFVHDKTYEELESSFFGLVQMYDPMQLVHFLHRYPYHVSTLIQVSKVAKQDQNNALAADLIERALFTFGRASLSEFRKKLEEGKARLSFYRPENRQLFLAGHNLIKHLTLKGTVRTALEWTKLLLSLDPSDPYGLTNWIHPLAIRAYEAQWFVDLCATRLLGDFVDTGLYAKQTLVLAYLQLKDTERAYKALLDGVKNAPWVYCCLFSALNLDSPKAIWGIKPRDPSEELSTELYIHMTKDLWDTPPVIAFLKSVVTDAPRNLEYKSLPASPDVSLATARFVYLDNTPSLMSAVPSSILHGEPPNFDFDPLPPPKDENIFSSDVQRLPWIVAENEELSAGDGHTYLRRRVAEAAFARLLQEINQGIDIRPELERLAAMVDDERWFGQFRAPLDELIRAHEHLQEEHLPPDYRPRFQARVEDLNEDDEDDEDDQWYHPDGTPIVREYEDDGENDTGNGNDNANANAGLMGMFYRAAGIMRGNASAGGAGPAADVAGASAGDTQGLPDPVYRALEDLELPDLPGAWQHTWEDAIRDGDYSAITGRGRRDGEGGHDDGQPGGSGGQH